MKTLYSQRDSRWASMQLGTVVGITIGSDGCFVTSSAMVATDYGHTIFPDQLNVLFSKNPQTGNPIYINGDLEPDDALHQLYTDIQYLGSDHYETIPADLSKLAGYMNDASNRTIVCIDMGAGNVHFAVVDSCDGIIVMIRNPWTGMIENFTQLYGDPKKNILRFINYKGTVLAQDATGSGSSESANNIALANEFKILTQHNSDWTTAQKVLDAITARDNAINDLTKKLETSDKNAADYEKLASMAQTDKDTALAKKDLECQRALQDQKNSFFIDETRTIDQYKEQIKLLQDKVDKGVQTIIKPPPIPKKFMPRLIFAASILFNSIYVSDQKEVSK